MYKNGYFSDHVIDQVEIIRQEQFMQPNQWIHRINQYVVLCIYETEKKPKMEKQDDFVLLTLPLQQKVDSNTFIIWERTYKESEELFINLRKTSRNRMIKWIANTIVDFLLKKYEEQQDITTWNVKMYPNLQIEDYVERIEKMIRANTFLSDESTWEELSAAIRIQLTEWVLEEMEKTYGLQIMELMSNEELNDVFYQMITKKFSSDNVFLSKYIKVVNDYTAQWINSIIASMKLSDYTKVDIEDLLQISNIQDQKSNTSRKDLLVSLTVNQQLQVMNNAPYQYVREALYKKNFVTLSDTPWPTTPLIKGNLEGSIQFRPFQNTNIPSVWEEAVQQANSVTDLEVDMFDALCSHFLLRARYSEDIIEIKFDDLLSIRGLKPKLGGEGRRGGYEQKQRQQVMKALIKIQSLWMELEKATIYEKGKPVQTQLHGRTFLFVTSDRKEYDISSLNNQKKFTYTVDKVFAKYLYGSGRQIALLPLQTLAYNPYRQTWEKRLARYFSWRWRTQARKGDFFQPNKIRTLIEAIGEKVNERSPSRTRDRLEKAFDQLLEDGVIKGWHYNNWDEMVVHNRGWAQIWLNSTITVLPPEVIKQQYQTIERAKKTAPSLIAAIPMQNKQLKDVSIGEHLRSVRQQLQLSMMQVAEELEISSSYVSNIERGNKVPSTRVHNRIIKWMQRVT